MSSLGDIVHTLPAITDAARAIPGLRFDWAVEEAFAEIPAWHPAVDRVIPVALRRWRRRPWRDFRGPEWRAAVAALRARPYTALIDAQGLLKSAFIARLVDAPRYGMDWSSAREPLATLSYHHRLRVPRRMHAIDRLRRLFAGSLSYPLPGPEVDYGLPDAMVAAPGDAPQRLLFLHGTAREEKLWPVGHWIDLARRAIGAGFEVALPWGDAAEQRRAQAIADGVPAAGGPHVVVLPRLDLTAMARQLREAAAVVAVDTGLGHLAAALEAPTVSLYGPTDPERIGTVGPRQVRVVPSPGVGSMAAIEPARVWQGTQSLLRDGSPRGGAVVAGH
jgi:heptosyltransferase-1